ncbi:MAG: hypothetical protein ABUT39_14230 [Acidobacteriota bacterium]
MALSTSDASEGSVGATSLTFQPDEWKEGKTVTVIGANDTLADGSVSYVLLTGPATSGDERYDKLDPPDVGLINQDDEAPGITVFPTAGLVTREDGGTAVFYVALDSQPAADTVVTLASTNRDEGTVAPETLTFTPSDWSTVRRVVVTGVDDGKPDGDTTYGIQVSGAAPVTVTVINLSPGPGANTNNHAVLSEAEHLRINTQQSLSRTAQLTIALRSRPDRDFTVDLTSEKPEQLAVSPRKLTFSPALWRDPLPVTATAVDDDWVEAAAMIKVQMETGGISMGFMPAYIYDNDHAGMALADPLPPDRRLPILEGRQGSFRLRLTSRPFSPVTVTPSSASPDVKILSAPLVFQPEAWDQPQTVTFEAPQDDGKTRDRQNLQIELAASGDEDYGKLGVLRVDLIWSDDDPNLVLTPIGDLVTDQAGRQALFTVALASQPAQAVTLTFAAVPTTEAKVTTAAGTDKLVFNADDWSNARTVTIRGLADDPDPLDEDDRNYTLKITAASTDLIYGNGWDPQDLTVRQIDTDTSGFTLSTPEGTYTGENGTRIPVDVKLTTRPSATVVVDLAVSDATEGSVENDPPSLTFEPGSWKTAGRVWVKGKDDHRIDGDVDYFLRTGPVHGDARYVKVDPRDVALVNRDDGDHAGLNLSEDFSGSNPLRILEGGSRSFKVALTCEPRQAVTVDVTLAEATSGLEVTPTSLEFTPENWDKPQEVTLEAPGDDEAGQDYWISLQLDPDSEDDDYKNLSSTTVPVYRLEDDAAGFRVSPSHRIVRSGGPAVSFGVKATSRPREVGDPPVVSLPIWPERDQVTPSTLLFSSGEDDWKAARQGWIQPGASTGETETWVVRFGLASGGDPGFEGLFAPPVTVVQPGEQPGLTVAPAHGLATTEDGGTATFEVALNTRPDVELTVGLTSSDPREGVPSPASLRFTPDDWSEICTVTVTGQDDGVEDGPKPYTIDLSGAGSASVDLVNLPRASGAGVIFLSHASTLTVREGRTETFGVVLSRRPEGTVTVRLDLSGPGASLVPNVLSFTPHDWNQPRQVLVVPRDDARIDGGKELTVSAFVYSSDPAFSGPQSGEVLLTVIDDDRAGYDLYNVASIEVGEGSSASFRVALLSDPDTPTTLKLTADSQAVTVTPDTLTFEPGSREAQLVTVEAAKDDFDSEDASLSLSIETSKGDAPYLELAPLEIPVTVRDDDQAGISFELEGTPSTRERGAALTLGLRLRSQPRSDLQVRITSSRPEEGGFPGKTLTLDARRWREPYPVAIEGGDDDWVDGPVEYDLQAKVEEGDPVYVALEPARITLTNLDDDVAGFRVSPTHLITRPGGQPVPFEVKVISRPKDGDVHLPLASSDEGRGTVSPAILTFPDHGTEWKEAQEAAVTPAGPPTEENVSYQIVFSAAEAADPAYQWRAPDPITVIQTGTRPGLTVAPLRGLVTTEDGGTATFSVALNARPETDLTVSITSSDEGEGIPSASALVFTPEDWEAVRTVTVTGQDDHENDGPAVFSITLQGEGFEPVDVQLINLPSSSTPEVPAEVLILAPAEGLTLVEGDFTTFEVVLSRRPAQDVVVYLDGGQGLGLVSPTINIRAGDWNLPHSATVWAPENSWYNRTRVLKVTTTHTWSPDPDFDGLDPDDVTVTVLNDDPADFFLSYLDNTFTTEAGGTASIGLNLNGRPAQDTTFSIRSTNEARGKVDAETLVVPASGADVPGTLAILVTGVDDEYADAGGYEIEVEAVAGDPSFVALGARRILLGSLNDDSYGLRATPLELITRPGGLPATFLVEANSRPRQDVELSVASSDPRLGTVSPDGIAFQDQESWSEPRTVSVTPVGPPTEESLRYQVRMGPAASGDALYYGLTAGPVTVVQTGTRPGLTVAPLQGLVTTEDGATATFSVALNARPETDLTVSIASSDEGEGIPSASALAFTPEDWEAVRTVTVTGQDDHEDDGPASYTIALRSDRFEPVEVGLINLPSSSTPDTPAEVLVLAPAGGLTVEEGGFATFHVVLSRRPAHEVRVEFHAEPGNLGSVAGVALLTPDDWYLPHPVTVFAADDFVYNRARTFQVITSPTWSPDPDFDGLDPDDVIVTVLDNDAARFSLSHLDNTFTTEAGGTASIGLTLDSRPAQDTIFNIRSVNEAEGRVDLATVTIPATGEEPPQSVTILVTGADDSYDDGDVSYEIEVEATSGDPAFTSLGARSITLTNLDDDSTPETPAEVLVRAPDGGLEIREGGSATFDLVLSRRPDFDVRIDLRTDPGGLGSIEDTVTLTPDDWDQPRPVTVRVSDDLIYNGTRTFRAVTGLTLSEDPDFGGLDPSDVTVTVLDDESADFTLAYVDSSVTTEARGTASFSLTLNGRPAQDTTFRIRSTDEAEGTVGIDTVEVAAGDGLPDPIHLTVIGVDDDYDDDNVLYDVEVEAVEGDPAFTSLGVRRLEFLNVDDDFTAYEISPLYLITRPGGPPASFEVGVRSRPRNGDVHLPVTSLAPDKGTVEPTEIVLSGDAAEWRETRRAVVTPIGPASQEPVTYQIRLGPAQAGDPLYNGSLARNVTVIQTGSQPGLAVAPTQGLATTENGGTATFSVALNTRPANPLTVTISSSDPGEGLPSPSSLVFTPDDWQVIRNVTVTGQQDSQEDGPVRYTVTVAAKEGTGLNPVIVELINLPAPGPSVPAEVLVLAPPAGITLREGEDSAFYVVLSRPPADRVVVRFENADTLLGTVFSPWNWSVPRPVPVRAPDDDLVNGTRTFQVLLTATRSSDPAFDGLDPADVTVTVLDDDTNEGSYNTLAPCRVYDSQVAVPGGDLLRSGIVRIVPVRGLCDVPARARAVALNITAIKPSGNGNLSVYPADEIPTGTSAINFRAGLNRANNGIFRLSDDGRLAIRPFVAGEGTVHVAVDIVGFFE